MNKEHQLSEIFEICGQELDEVMDKYESRHIKNIWRFLKLDMRFYLKSAVLGLGFTMLWCCLFTNAVLSVWSGYFIFLVLLSAYQQYRIKEYDMQEVVAGCYINPARIFCYQSIALALIETFMLVLCYLFLLALTPVELPEFLLKIYIPLCFSQGLLLWLVKYIRHTLVAMGTAAGSYALTIWLANCSQWVLAYTHSICVFVSFIYLLALAKILMSQKEGLWN